jgi:very-short-patch-repair endonuclease
MPATPTARAPAHCYEVDFLWREQRLVVETDGWATHGDRRSFEADRAS